MPSTTTPRPRHRPRLPAPRCAGLGPLVLIAAAAAAPAQTTAELRANAGLLALPARLPALLTVASDHAERAELSGGHLRIDAAPRTDLTSITATFRDDFMRSPGGDSMHAEGTMTYGSGESRVNDAWAGTRPGQETSVDSRTQAVLLDLGIGSSMLLRDGGLVQPMLHGGLAYVHNDGDYGGPGAAFTRPLADGLLFNWDGWFGSYGGSLALRPESSMFDDLETIPLLRYDVRRFEGLAADDATLEQGQTLQWATLRVDFAGPTGWTFRDRPLSWEAEVGYRYMFGNSEDVVGYPDYYEVGLGLGAKLRERDETFDELHLGATVQFGEDVFGWSIGLNVKF